MNGSIFSLQNLTLTGDSTPRLDAVTLQIPSGVTAIVGLSGAGKTSLLNVLAGFETSFSGELKSNLPGDQDWTEGNEGSSGVSSCRSPTPATHQTTDDIASVADAERRLPLFWVPQSGGLWPHLSVERHLQIVDHRSRQSQKSSVVSGRFSERTDEFLESFDLAHRRRALPAELSQGERSRLSLARALTTRARVLLLDEPLSHVDPVRKPDYWNVVRKIVAEENISMVFTSHEPETVLRQARQVICLDAGRVAFQGSVSRLYENPPNAQLGAFLGPLNWFPEDEAAMCFPGRANRESEFSLRPERVRIDAADESALELVSQLHCGAYSESVVRDAGSGITRSVLHQVPEARLTIGQRIAFRVADIQERLGVRDK